MHRSAAELDGWWRVDGRRVLERSGTLARGGASLGFDRERSYGDVDEMLATERARADGIDAVAIMTPNDTHYPLRRGRARRRARRRLRQAGDARLRAGAATSCARDARAGRLFAVAHGYSAYPMTRYARQLVRDGAIGALRLVQVEYIQSGLATRVEDGPQNNRLRWILDPAAQRPGAGDERDRLPRAAPRVRSSSDQRVARVCADVGALRAGPQGGRLRVGADRVRRRRARHVHRRRRPRPAARTTSGCASTARRACSTGGIASRRTCARAAGRAGRARSAAAIPFLPPEIIALGRTPRGHPEGPARGVREHLRRGGAGAHGARARRDRRRRSPIRASRTARTRWRSSRRASRRSGAWVDVKASG